MDALDVLYHGRNNLILPLKAIVPHARYGILPATFLHSRALNLIDADPAASFRQHTCFNNNYLFFSAFRYMLIDDNNACRMLTVTEDLADWWFETNVNQSITSSRLQAA